MQVSSNLNFQKKSQLVELVVHTGSSLPGDAWHGGLFYVNDGTDSQLYWSNGSEWIAVGEADSILAAIIAGPGLHKTVDGDEIILRTDPDDQTLENSGTEEAAVIRIRESGVDTQHLATDAVETEKIKDSNVILSKLQDIDSFKILGNIESEEGVVQQITILTDLTGSTEEAHDNIPTSKSVQEYVDGIVTGLGSLQGGWDASTESEFPSGANKGDFWYSTGAGDLGTPPNDATLDVGDVLIANTDGASTTDAGDWVIVETNREQATTDKYGWVRLATTQEARAFSGEGKVLTPKNLGDVRATQEETDKEHDDSPSNTRFITPQGLANRRASETQTGIARIATQSEVNDGEDDETIVTPAKLDERLSSIDSDLAEIERLWLDVGSGDSVIVTHNLDSRHVSCELFDSNYNRVLTNIQNTSENTVTISFADSSLNPGNLKLSVTKV